MESTSTTDAEFGDGNNGGNDAALHGLECLRSLIGAASDLFDHEYPKYSADDLIAYAGQLETLARSVWATQVRVVDEIDQRGMAASRSCTSTQSLLRQCLRISTVDAGNRVRAARLTQPQDQTDGCETPPELPLLAAILPGGAVDPEHVRILTATMRRISDLDEDTRAEAERTLVGYAADVDPDQFRRIARHLEEVLRPDGTDPDVAAEKMELNLGCRNPNTGLTRIDGALDDHGMAILRTTIDALSAPRPTIDGVADSRPAALRRAQALIEAVGHLMDNARLPDRGGERPHLTVTLNWDLLRDRAGTATLDDGMTLTPATARQLLCDATVIPAVLGGDGQVLDLGRSSRTFPAPLRRAIALRDKGCTWPGCDRPPSWTDAHHIRFWHRDFGPTDHTNGTLLCRRHHTEIHKDQWRIEPASDGTPEFIPPKWIDVNQRPRRNTVHHLAPEFLLPDDCTARHVPARAEPHSAKAIGGTRAVT